MEKRLIIFVVLALVIIFLYPTFINLMSPPKQQIVSSIEPLEETLSPRDQHLEKSVHDDLPGNQTTTAEAPVDRSEPPEAQIDLSNVVEVEKIVESDLYRVVITNMGGTIKSWTLKKYTEQVGEVKEAIEMRNDAEGLLPLTLVIPGEVDASRRVFQMDESALRLSASKPEGVVRLVATDESGRKIIKEIRFYHDRYLADFKVETSGYPQNYDLTLGTNFGISDWNIEAGRGKGVGAISLIDTEVFREAPKDMEGDRIDRKGKPKWIALQSKYFISALIPKGEAFETTVSVEKGGEEAVSSQIRLEGRSGDRIDHFSLYVGPKDYDLLNDLKVNLDESIDFGWFIFGSWLPVRLISKLIFYLLRFFYSFTGNYGLAIIFVTVLIKVVFYPITKKSLHATKAMAAVQPKVAALKKKWGKNKEQMNKELIKLYKTEKVNPMGGCLPMLVQIPVFISLFNILYTTIDLRQAPFFLWIQDLSQMDPYYVLPVIMGATMFLQQYTMPSTMEASQQKIMQFLPIVYTFFFLNFPSGLVLYWLVNNCLTIVQQQMIKKQTA